MKTEAAISVSLSNENGLGRYAKGFSFSFAIHLAVIVIFFVAQHFAPQPKEIDLTDFNFMITDGSLTSAAAAKAIVQAPVIPQSTQKTVVDKVVPVKPITKPVVKPVAVPVVSQIATEPALVAEEAVVASEEVLVEETDIAAYSETAITDSDGATAGGTTRDLANYGNGIGNGSGEDLAAQYSRSNFAYIQKLISQNLTYPSLARKNNWAGVVVVNFVINLDGSIDNLKVVESGGYTILDNAAMKAVRKAEPFPVPPVQARITIPVEFNLQ